MEHFDTFTEALGLVSAAITIIRFALEEWRRRKK